MSKKTILVLSILFIVLGSFAVFDPFQLKEKREEKKEKETVLFWIKDKKLSEFTIADASQKIKYNFRCQETSGCPVDSQSNWQILEPVTEDADSANISSFLNSLQTLSPIDRIEFKDQEPNLQEYGLDKDGLRLEFKIAGESGAYELKLGNKASVGDSLYAKASGKNDVLLIATYFTDSLKKDFVHWRNKRFFKSLKTEAITELSWKNNGKLIAATQKDGFWNLKSPLEAKASSKIFNGLAGSIAFLSASRILEAKKDAALLEKIEKDKSFVELTVKAEDKISNIRFFKIADGKSDHLFVKTDSQTWYGEVDLELFNRFTKELVDYRNRQILEYSEQAKIETMELEFPRDRARALFKRGADREWVQSGGEPVKLSLPRLNQFLDKLSAADVKDFLRDPAKIELLKKLQDLKIRLFDKEKKLMLEQSFLVSGKTAALTEGELKGELRLMGPDLLSVLPIRLKDLDIENNKQVVIESHQQGDTDGHDHSH